MDEHIEKINALLNKTIQNGATEEEAMQSILMAKKLMNKYGLTEEKIKQKKFTKENFGVGGDTSTKTITLFEKIIANAISKYTNTKAFQYTLKKNHNVLLFFGDKIDVSLAMFIRKVCVEALKTNWELYKNNLKKGNIAKYRISYAVGMADRIVERIEKMCEVEVTSGKGELVVLKNQLTETFFQSLNFTTKNNLPVQFNNYEKVYKKGREDGESVCLHRQTQTNPKTLKIKKG